MQMRNVFLLTNCSGLNTASPRDLAINMQGIVINGAITEGSVLQHDAGLKAWSDTKKHSNALPETIL